MSSDFAVCTRGCGRLRFTIALNVWTLQRCTLGTPKPIGSTPGAQEHVTGYAHSRSAPAPVCVFVYFLLRYVCVHILSFNHECAVAAECWPYLWSGCDIICSCMSTTDLLLRSRPPMPIVNTQGIDKVDPQLKLEYNIYITRARRFMQNYTSMSTLSWTFNYNSNNFHIPLL